MDPTVPIDDGKGSFQLPVLGYYQSLNLLGRSANVTVLLPYVHGNFEGTVDGSFLQVTAPAWPMPACVSRSTCMAGRPWVCASI